MAENESLDLESPRARRWSRVLEGALKGESCDKVGLRAFNALWAAISKAMKDFASGRVLIEDFLGNRTSRRNLQKLVNQTRNHQFAELLASVLNSNPQASNTQCVCLWQGAIVDKIFEQFEMKMAGKGPFASFSDTSAFLRNVRAEMGSEIERVAANIVLDRKWRPRARAKHGVGVRCSTAQILSTSLLGGRKL
jgi:hypothetical protein